MTLSKRLSNRWSFLGGFAVNRTTGDTQAATVASTGQPAGDLNNPNLVFRNGIVGDDSFGVSDLQSWLQAAADANPDPLVILMGCGADQAGWQGLLSQATGAISGVWNAA